MREINQVYCLRVLNNNENKIGYQAIYKIMLINFHFPPKFRNENELFLIFLLFQN